MSVVVSGLRPIATSRQMLAGQLLAIRLKPPPSGTRRASGPRKGDQGGIITPVGLA